MQKTGRLRDIRRKKLLTLDDVYVKSGRKIQTSKLSKIERGILIPSERDKKLISKALRMKKSELFPSEG